MRGEVLHHFELFGGPHRDPLRRRHQNHAALDEQQQPLVMRGLPVPAQQQLPAVRRQSPSKTSSSPCWTACASRC
ncbi:hypothetical protein NKH77_23340 [Streptomyces sp. M19]